MEKNSIKLNPQMPNSYNYQVSGFAESLSISSEPPDIRNWFSSYVYDSPQLNTYENCEDNCLTVPESKEERVDDGERGNKQEEDEKKLEGTTKVNNKRVSDEVDSNSSTKYTTYTKYCDKKKSIKVSDFADTLSLPSEPPDIRNWFSSYAYESPEMDTYKNYVDNGLRDGNSEEERLDDGEKGNKQEEGQKEKLERTIKNKDTLVSDQDDSSTSTTYTNAPKDCDQTKSIKVLGTLSDSLALSPEPPHVGKWFSSYVYESPLLDACADFSSSESQGIELDGAGNYARKSYEENNKSKLGGLRNDAERTTLPISEDGCFLGLSTNSNLVEDTNSQLQCSDKASNIVAVNRPNLTDLNIHDDILKLESTEDHTIASAEVRKGDLYSEDFICREPLNNASTGKDKESSYKKAQIRRLLQHNNVTGGSTDKENSFPEYGFISTRRKIKERTSKRSVHDPLIVNRENVPKRQSFSERTNFQHNDGLEITGKWKCPRKSNSQLGPPLKQLRLEKWVNRT